jgi:hypothetical protein
MRWRSIFLCVAAFSVGCGDSDTTSGDAGSLDAAQNEAEAEAAVGDDAEAGPPVYDAATDSSGGNDAGPPADSGTEDAAGEAGTDAGDDGGPGAVEGGVTVLFPCGASACNAQIQFCLHTTGPLGSDGSTNEMYSCRTIPSQCEPGPTCACLSMTPASQGCPCTVAVGLEVDCYFP